MEFINPGLIGLAALAAVPLAIHLLHRPKPKARKFPSLMFLRRCARRSRAFASIRNLILMALRMAAVALIALAVARPRIVGAAPGSEEGLAAALVLDDSFRMGYGEGGLSRFDEGRRRALDLLASLPPGSESCVAFASGESTDRSPDRAAAEVALRLARETTLSVPLLPALVEGGRALHGSKARRREIHVFTDLARFAWSGASRESLRALAGLPVYVHDVAKDGAVNAAVAKVDLIPAVPRKGRPVEVAATIASWGRAEPITVVLKMSGHPSEEKAVAVPDGGTSVIRFRLTPEDVRVLHGAVSVVTPDPLSIDDARHFAAPVGRPPRVLVVEADPDPDSGRAPFLSYALAPPSLGDPGEEGVTVASPGWLAGRDLAAFDVIFLSEPLAVGVKDLQRLAAWVHEGGGLAVLASPRENPQAFDELTRAGIFPPVRGGIEASIRLSPRNSDSAAFHAFRAGRNGDLTAATFTHRLAFGALDKWRPALLFDDGAPAVLETLAGRGRLLALSFEASAVSTDLPRFPSFVPLMHEIARYLAGTTSADREFEAGVPVLLPLPRPSGASEFHLSDLATGGRETRASDPAAPVLAVSRALPPGRYQVEIAGSIRPFAVNIDPAGSDSTRIGRDELARLLTGSEVSFAFQRASVGEIRQSRLGQDLTLAALLVVILTLLVELWMAKAP